MTAGSDDANVPLIVLFDSESGSIVGGGGVNPRAVGSSNSGTFKRREGKWTSLQRFPLRRESLRSDQLKQTGMVDGVRLASPETPQAAPGEGKSGRKELNLHGTTTRVWFCVPPVPGSVYRFRHVPNNRYYRRLASESSRGIYFGNEHR